MPLHFKKTESQRWKGCALNEIKMQNEKSIYSRLLTHRAAYQDN